MMRIVDYSTFALTKTPQMVANSCACPHSIVPRKRQNTHCVPPDAVCIACKWRYTQWPTAKKRVTCGDAEGLLRPDNPAGHGRCGTIPASDAWRILRGVSRAGITPGHPPSCAGK